MIRVMLLTLLLTGCGLFGSKPTASVEAETAQVQQAESGSSAQAENIGNVTTVNEAGIPTYWFIVGALVFGMIIPQPRIIRWLF